MSRHKAGKIEWCNFDEVYRIEFDEDDRGLGNAVTISGPESLAKLIAAAPELEAENARLLARSNERADADGDDYAALKAENSRLQTIVDRLPVLGDGVRVEVRFGLLVYFNHPDYETPQSWHVGFRSSGEVFSAKSGEIYVDFPEDFYSTPEAARAAKSRKAEGGGA